MKHIQKYILLLSICFVLMVTSCQQPGGNTTGSEFMPDMGHSIAYEANYYNYYYNNTWGSEDEYYEYAKPRMPVAGTMPRGSGGVAVKESVAFTLNGSAPYYYADTEEGRAAAMAEIIDNPYPITEAGLAKGKKLYDIFCSTCHGEKADGLGYLVRDDGGVYPVQPAILNTDEFIAATNGRYYHSIMKGRNLMGSYADKISYEERWQVIHYIRSLQAKEKKLEYNQYVNTLNNVDRPAGDIAVVVEADHDSDNDQEGHHDDHDHNSEHGVGDHHDVHDSDDHDDDSH